MGGSNLDEKHEPHTDYVAGESDQQAMAQLPSSPVDADRKAESRIRLKMDFGLVPLISLLYLLAFIDRSNIGNARLAGLEKDLNLHNYEYNTALSVFYISYIVFEIPCNALCKYMGPAWFIPCITLGFGILTICTAFATNFATLCVVRFFLGILEAGMMPSLVYFLSRWYRQSELTFRVSLFIISASLAGAFGGLLASAILRLESLGSLHSWRMIFAIEGTATALLGVICFFALPDGPETALWLTRPEKDLAIARLQSESIFTAELVDQFSWNRIKLGIFNPVVLPTSVIFLLNSITVHGVSFFLPTIVRTIFPTHSVSSQQLLTVPPYVLGAMTCAATSYVSWRVNRRAIFMIFCAPLTVLGYAMFLASTDPNVRYGATFLPFMGIFTYGALTNSHVAANVVSDTAKSSAIATNVMLGNIGGLISTWAFLPSDAPHYKVGNGLNLAVQASMIVVATTMYYWTKKDNARRETLDVVAELEGKTTQEIQDMDWKHPGFKWRN
ncbi:hypothetical protein ED733_000942 [Metarhizium rileyi]|uniref:Major facilitator superfamily (MFS) profile domain-containing protein n=1 Tax=Metarhizium rileyi (strain RCEF 4871) TaxID=1649241 RepID=A0A5C6GBM5_METRR|nr:hypothetical protein ED733_000942 [Metarhizium rileyi]